MTVKIKKTSRLTKELLKTANAMQASGLLNAETLAAIRELESTEISPDTASYSSPALNPARGPGANDFDPGTNERLPGVNERLPGTNDCAPGTKERSPGVKEGAGGVCASGPGTTAPPSAKRWWNLP
jgi:hypothetical protein